jgi:hypothetical protein
MVVRCPYVHTRHGTEPKESDSVDSRRLYASKLRRERLGSPRAYEQLKRRQLQFNVAENAEDFVWETLKELHSQIASRVTTYNLPVREPIRGRKTCAYPKVAIKGGIVVLVVVLWKHCRKSRHGKLSNRNRRGPRKKAGGWMKVVPRAVDNPVNICFSLRSTGRSHHAYLTLLWYPRDTRLLTTRS